MVAMVAAAQRAIISHPFFTGDAAMAFGLANGAVKAALAALMQRPDMRSAAQAATSAALATLKTGGDNLAIYQAVLAALATLPPSQEVVPKHLLDGRDNFIVSKGLWSEFVATLSPPTPTESPPYEGGTSGSGLDPS
jgi:hypothetical protein